ncbi:MAG TPA: hypothetical protein VMZ06_00950 [Candidatus Bathyarchaeia archaeon]|nr:hypothetical protein [Candidatus Bathyarchaeia archaeon]
MAQVDLPPQRLSEYERAICYYTLPKITHPVAFGLVVAYAVVVLEVLAILCYGLMSDNAAYTRIGEVVFVGIIVIGMVAFLGRALLNEVRMRKALAVAKTVPDAISHVEDIPDPFQHHLLLRHPLHARGDLFPCTDNDGNIAYFVESAAGGPWWKIKDAQDKEVLRVRVEQGSTSFTFGGNVPARLAVYDDAQELGRIRRRVSFTSPVITVECKQPAATYTVQRGNIFREKKLVGRIYYLHKSLYLDIQKDAMHPAILGLFITMT